MLREVGWGKRKRKFSELEVVRAHAHVDPDLIAIRAHDTVGLASSNMHAKGFETRVLHRGFSLSGLLTTWTTKSYLQRNVWV